MLNYWTLERLALVLHHFPYKSKQLSYCFGCKLQAELDHLEPPQLNMRQLSASIHTAHMSNMVLCSRSSADSTVLVYRWNWSLKSTGSDPVEHFAGQDQTPFYSLIPENKTWFEAQLYCRENHTDLVTIRNEEENQLVKNAVNGSDSIWIGLRFIHVSPVYATWEQALDHCDKKFAGLLRFESEDDQTETERELKRQNISGPVWVGLRQSRLFGFWIWSNGLYVGNWIKWKGGSPPEHQMSQHCGALEKRVNDTFELSDKDCRSEFRFLCEVK
ncbi:secretory phospholipase A2 receptor [Labeo rohita]|uniref:Secretory phospholipase A2 receptor n=1 Tax=Labeo rohita TaxID=84645 RepID=A0A498MXG8_LABRO|nr:secretory phospholipase A2 receptor [Labeo rohita]